MSSPCLSEQSIRAEMSGDSRCVPSARSHPRGRSLLIQGQIVHADVHMPGTNQADDMSLLNSGTTPTKRGDDTADFSNK